MDPVITGQVDFAETENRNRKQKLKKASPSYCAWSSHPYALGRVVTDVLSLHYSPFISWHELLQY